ncbi:MAG: DUF58 domain-containing protein [Actinomycetales bacterium]
MLGPLTSTLTMRGWIFLGSGVAALAAAVATGQRDALRLAVLLLAVPALGVALLLLAPAVTRLRRQLTPAQIEVGGQASVHVQILNPSRTLTRVQRAEEALPEELGEGPRFSIDRLAPDQALSVSYHVTGTRRGEYPLGPMTLYTGDALGMAQLARTYPRVDGILVLPRIHPLSGRGPGAGTAGVGESAQMHTASAGEYDVTTRQYRQGDDLRRVHWPSTARRGELMVRRQEQADEHRATVLLDARLDGHRGEPGDGSGAGSPGGDGSLEWAISAAASVCVHLGEAGFAVRLIVDGTDPGWVDALDGEARTALLSRLAVLTPQPADTLDQGVSLVATEPDSHLIVAVLGEVTAHAVRPLTRHAGGVALLAAPASWADLPDGQAARLEADLAEARDRLAHARWRTVTYGARTAIPDAWAAAVGDAGSSPADDGPGIKREVGAPWPPAPYAGVGGRPESWAADAPRSPR